MACEVARQYEGHIRWSKSGARLWTNLVEHVVDELDLVLNFGSSEDGQEGPLGVLQRLGKELELFLHQEPGGTLGKLDADHGRVASVGGTKGVVDVDRSERGERLAEGIDGGLVGCGHRSEWSQLLAWT